jgi:hypothetical protein
MPPWGDVALWELAVDPLFCNYRNTSDRMVIVRCCGPSRFYLERVVFPFELLTFQCPHDSEVQIWSHGVRGAELTETLEARSLRMAETPPPRRSDWMPLPLERTVGIRDNSSSICLERI